MIWLAIFRLSVFIFCVYHSGRHWHTLFSATHNHLSQWSVSNDYESSLKWFALWQLHLWTYHDDWSDHSVIKREGLIVLHIVESKQSQWRETSSSLFFVFFLQFLLLLNRTSCRESVDYLAAKGDFKIFWIIQWSKTGSWTTTWTHVMVSRQPHVNVLTEK